MPSMKLIGSPTSPYVRKVRVVMAEKKLDFQLVVEDPWGADVVLNAVRIGGLAARVFDESYPQRRGCPGEETMGPGGLANALRTVPVVRSWWATVMDVAPDALHINLTNPSGIVVAALQREFGSTIFSVCDSPVVFCDKIADRLGVETHLIPGASHHGSFLRADDALTIVRPFLEQHRSLATAG